VCGKKIALVSGSSEEEDIIPLLHTICQKAGKPDVKALTLPEVADPPVAVRDKRAVGALVDGADGSFIVSSAKNDFQLAPGPQLLDSPFGIAVTKGSPLIAKIQAALQSMIDDGSYRTLMTRWGLTAGLLKRVTVNGATS
jgi:polar amino acid transport system substrate-binding protein